MKKCGVCGNEIDWYNRWEIINHYSKDTIYGKQGVEKTVYTFCSERCMISWLNRNVIGFLKKPIIDSKLIGKTFYRKKKIRRKTK